MKLRPYQRQIRKLIKTVSKQKLTATHSDEPDNDLEIMFQCIRDGEDCIAVLLMGYGKSYQMAIRK